MLPIRVVGCNLNCQCLRRFGINSREFNLAVQILSLFFNLDTDTSKRLPQQANPHCNAQEKKKFKILNIKNELAISLLFKTYLNIFIFLLSFDCCVD